MKVGVCLKQVPASDSRIAVKDPSAGVDTSQVKWEINPYDEFALEEALKLKDAKKATEVVIFSLGDKDADARIRDGLARGADRAVRVDGEGFAGADSLTIARGLAAAAKAEGVELLFCGKQATDSDNSQVPAMIAELLGWSQIMVVSQFELGDGSVKGWRAAGGGVSEVVEATLPAVISADKGLNQPRYATMRNIMMAKRKKIAVKSAGDLGVDTSASSVSLSNWGLPPERPAGRIIGGDPATAAKELVRLLREEAKVI